MELPPIIEALVVRAKPGDMVVLKVSTEEHCHQLLELFNELKKVHPNVLEGTAVVVSHVPIDAVVVGGEKNGDSPGQ